MKSYFFGGQRVASAVVPGAGWQTYTLAAMETRWSSGVAVAAQWGPQRPVLHVTLAAAEQRAAATAAGSAVALLAVALFVLPAGRRRRALVGLRAERAAALVVTVAVVTGTLPWAVVIAPEPAHSQTPPSPAPGAADISYFHYDHLGSPLVISDGNGAAVEKIRYHPYGAVRARFDGNDQPIGAPQPEEIRYEFTGYEAERTTGLLYANARFYDPELGSFLTQDPAAEFWSPYTYVGWDPVNGTDPTGACVFGLDCLALLAIMGISAAVGFTVSAIQAGINGASFGDALLAGLIGGGIAAVGAAILGPIGHAALEAGGPWAAGYLAVTISSGGYGASESFRQGQNFAGDVGVALLALGAYAGYRKLTAEAQPSSGQWANGAGDEGLGARNAASGSQGPVDGFELSIQDRAANPTQGELVLDLAEGRGLAQIRLDVDRFGTSVLQGTQARFDASGGSVRFNATALVNPKTGQPDATIYGLAYRNVPQLGIDIGPPAFTSYREFALTYIHELSHAGLNLADVKGGLTAYQFEKSQWRYIAERKFGRPP